MIRLLLWLWFKEYWCEFVLLCIFIFFSCVNSPVSSFLADDCDKDGTVCSNGACLDSQCHCNDGFGGCNCQVPGNKYKIHLLYHHNVRISAINFAFCEQAQKELRGKIRQYLLYIIKFGMCVSLGDQFKFILCASMAELNIDVRETFHDTWSIFNYAFVQSFWAIVQKWRREIINGRLWSEEKLSEYGCSNSLSHLKFFIILSELIHCDMAEGRVEKFSRSDGKRRCFVCCNIKDITFRLGDDDDECPRWSESAKFGCHWSFGLGVYFYFLDFHSGFLMREKGLSKSHMQFTRICKNSYGEIEIIQLNCEHAFNYGPKLYVLKLNRRASRLLRFTQKVPMV